MGILDIITDVAAPFLQHPVIVFFLILLAVGADSYSAGQPSVPVLDYGFHYCIVTADVFFNPHQVCNQTPNLTASQPDQVCLSGAHYPTNSELNSICLAPTNPLGVFGSTFTGIINTTGKLANIQVLKDAKVNSWMIFILMIATTFIVWAVTASTRS